MYIGHLIQVTVWMLCLKLSGRETRLEQTDDAGRHTATSCRLTLNLKEAYPMSALEHLPKI